MDIENNQPKLIISANDDHTHNLNDLEKGSQIHFIPAFAKHDSPNAKV